LQDIKVLSAALKRLQRHQRTSEISYVLVLLMVKCFIGNLIGWSRRFRNCSAKVAIQGMNPMPNYLDAHD
jgi:hypothetical protein